jgi:hypothetical protein
MVRFTGKQHGAKLKGCKVMTLQCESMNRGSLKC